MRPPHLLELELIGDVHHFEQLPHRLVVLGRHEELQLPVQLVLLVLFTSPDALPDRTVDDLEVARDVGLLTLVLDLGPLDHERVQFEVLDEGRVCLEIDQFYLLQYVDRQGDY